MIKNITILYVDDEAMNLMAFKARFRREFEIFTAFTLDECLEVLSNHEIQLIISDQRMPQMTGVELLTVIKNKFPKIKRIILSGYIDDVQIHEGLKKGIVEKAYEKPVDMKEILNLFD